MKRKSPFSHPGDYDATLAFARKTKTKKPPPPEYHTPLEDITPWDAVLLEERVLLRRALVASKADVALVRRALLGLAPDAERDRRRLGGVVADLRNLQVPAAWREASSTPLVADVQNYEWKLSDNMTRDQEPRER